MSGGGYTALAHGFPEHPKVMGLHDRAFRFHIVALDWTGRNGTDGHIPARAVKVIAAILDTTAKRWPIELVETKLWKHDPAGDGFWINDYLVYNPSAESLRALSDKRRQAGIRGAEKRWRGEKGESEEDKSKAKANANGKSHGKEQIPAVAVAEQEELQDLPGRQFVPESLPIENELLLARLLARIGDHADQGTAPVVRSYAGKLPPAAIAKVIESIELNHPTDRAAYAVRALRNEINERSNAA